jgi:hypothetical protein
MVARRGGGNSCRAMLDDSGVDAAGGYPISLGLPLVGVFAGIRSSERKTERLLVLIVAGTLAACAWSSGLLALHLMGANVDG